MSLRTGILLCVVAFVALIYGSYKAILGTLDNNELILIGVVVFVEFVYMRFMFAPSST